MDSTQNRSPTKLQVLQLMQQLMNSDVDLDELYGFLVDNKKKNVSELSSSAMEVPSQDLSSRGVFQFTATRSQAHTVAHAPARSDVPLTVVQPDQPRMITHEDLNAPLYSLVSPVPNALARPTARPTASMAASTTASMAASTTASSATTMGFQPNLLDLVTTTVVPATQLTPVVQLCCKNSQGIIQSKLMEIDSSSCILDVRNCVQFVVDSTMSMFDRAVALTAIKMKHHGVANINLSGIHIWFIDQKLNPATEIDGLLNYFEELIVVYNDTHKYEFADLGDTEFVKPFKKLDEPTLPKHIVGCNGVDDTPVVWGCINGLSSGLNDVGFSEAMPQKAMNPTSKTEPPDLGLNGLRHDCVNDFPVVFYAPKVGDALVALGQETDMNDLMSFNEFFIQPKPPDLGSKDTEPGFDSGHKLHVDDNNIVAAAVFIPATCLHTLKTLNIQRPMVSKIKIIAKPGHVSTKTDDPGHAPRKKGRLQGRNKMKNKKCRVTAHAVAHVDFVMLRVAQQCKVLMLKFAAMVVATTFLPRSAMGFRKKRRR